jgi:uncharacterized protein (AIM24 family)
MTFPRRHTRLDRDRQHHRSVLSPPVTTDPSATVAWSGVSPDVEVNKNLSDMVGQESGERFQMNFHGGDGFVIVQPYEEMA